ncbi:MAG: ABC transporter permease subunit [Burkholderiales bacterium]
MDERHRPPTRWHAWALQALVVAAVLGLLAWIVGNALAQLRLRGAHAGFDFLLEPAGFQLGEGWFGDDSGQAMWRAFAAGLGNTLRVALPGMLLATGLGTLLGIGRTVAEPVLRRACSVYVETLRNVPLLVQLLMLYFALTHLLPDTDAPLRFAGAYLSKAGLALPWPAWENGRLFIERPEVEGFGITGGVLLTPEYLTLLLGLSAYTAAFVAETVRAGLQSVPQGQKDAARAMGLSGGQQLRFIVLPQALRLIVPSLGNQMLNLTKNSSLAVAIGYPDLVSVANTVLNQTGRAFECIAVLMAVYLTLSLLTAAAIHGWNARVMRRGR